MKNHQIGPLYFTVLPEGYSITSTSWDSYDDNYIAVNVHSSVLSEARL